MTPSADPRDIRIAELEAQLSAALAQIASLSAEVKDLRAQLSNNSGNSNKPPSSDGPEVKRPVGKPSGRKRGGQSGHGGAERARLVPDTVVDHRPSRCRRCDHALSGDDPSPAFAQVLELPEIRAHVTEHRAHTLCCTICRTETKALLPQQVRDHGFGPRLCGFVAYLTGRCRLSKRQVVELLSDALGTPMSLGAVCGVEQDVSQALAGPVEDARAALRAEPVVHMDETGWREDKKRAWLWTALGAAVTVFVVSQSRGKKVVREMLGEEFSGYLVTDRWCAYNSIDVTKRQLCWAHLLRDFQGMVDRGGAGAETGAALLERADQMMTWWHHVRDGSLTREKFKEFMKPVQAKVSRLLRYGVADAEPRTAGMCAEILKLEPALWTFVQVEGLEPTNNHAERAIRPAVLWRKGSFGNDSAVGARFTERILTAVATVRLQGRNVLQYLADACDEFRRTGRAPGLVLVPESQETP